jgi:hypothetical protein
VDPPLIDLAVSLLVAGGGYRLLRAVCNLILERQRQDHVRKLEKQRQDYRYELEKLRHRTVQQLLRNGAVADLAADGSVSTARGEVSGFTSAPSDAVAQGQIIPLPQRPENHDPE